MLIKLKPRVCYCIAHFSQMLSGMYFYVLLRFFFFSPTRSTSPTSSRLSPKYSHFWLQKIKMATAVMPNWRLQNSCPKTNRWRHCGLTLGPGKSFQWAFIHNTTTLKCSAKRTTVNIHVIGHTWVFPAVIVKKFCYEKELLDIWLDIWFVFSLTARDWLCNNGIKIIKRNVIAVCELQCFGRAEAATGMNVSTFCSLCVCACVCVSTICEWEVQLTGLLPDRLLSPRGSKKPEALPPRRATQAGSIRSPPGSLTASNPFQQRAAAQPRA